MPYTPGVPARFAALRFVPHLRGSSRATASRDLVAGLTVAAIAIPQSLAYALLAGLPPEMGLLAAALPAAITALFGSSPWLISGPTNPIALLLGVSVVAPAIAAGDDPVKAALATGLAVGVLLVAFAATGLARASRFLSDSVIVGFTTGVGILIVLRMLPELGTAPSAADAQVGLFTPRVLPLLREVAGALANTDAHSLAIAVSAPATMLALRRIDPRVPAGLIALVAASGAAWALGWTRGDDAIGIVGTLPRASFHVALPDLVAAERHASAALAIALLVTLQSIAAARGIRPPSGARIDPERELFAQGMGNVAASLLGGMASSGSLTRSAVARSAGAVSRLSGVASGVVIAAVLPFASEWIEQIPVAALVGLVVLSGVELVSFRTLRRAATTRGDVIVLAATLTATLWIDLVQAVYLGLFLSLGLLVRRAGRLQMVELVRSRAGRMREIPIDERTGETPAVLLHLEGDLNFAVASQLSERLAEIGARGPEVVVLRLKRARYLDATVLEALREAANTLRASGTRVLLCGLTPELAELLADSELAAALGDDALLPSGDRLFEGFERVLARTRELLAPRGDDEIFRADDAPGAWTAVEV